MKINRHIVLAFLSAFLCFPLAAFEKPTVTSLQQTKSKKPPYAVGVFVEGGKFSHVYDTDASSFNLNGFAISGGGYGRIYFHRKQEMSPKCYAQAELSYKYNRFSDEDILLERDFTGSLHYITPAVMLGTSFPEEIFSLEFTMGVSLDILTDFRGAPQSHIYGGLSKECMNRFCPKFKIGFSLASFMSVTFDIPLNEGVINLDKYTYYNRENIKTSPSANVSLRIMLPVSGSSHK